MKKERWEDDMEGGIVKFFNPKKFYGFIEPILGGPDVFFHTDAYWEFEERETEIDDLIPTRFPKKGDSVMFLKKFGGKGPFAERYEFLEEYEKRKLWEGMHWLSRLAVMYISYKGIKGKTFFLGIDILLPNNGILNLGKYSIASWEKLIEEDSLEACIAKIAWAAVNIEQLDQSLVMKKLAEAIARHNLDADLVIKTAGELDEDTTKNYKELSDIF